MTRLVNRILKRLVSLGVHHRAPVHTVAGLMVLGLSACAVDAGPGYGYGGSVGVDYYEPAGVAYGGWDPGYYVGPYRGRGDWHDGNRGGPPRSFQAAPGGHAPPGIPSGPRGGGGGHGGGAPAGGGGHGGGGGHR